MAKTDKQKTRAKYSPEKENSVNSKFNAMISVMDGPNTILQQDTTED